MHRFFIGILISVFFLLVTTQGAWAAERYVVPITVGGATYTLTVTVEESGISVAPGSPAVTVGEIALLESPEELAAHQSVDEQKAQAGTIAYEDLFRNNETHIGKIVRYVGKVLQVQENSCLFCKNPGYTLRLAVTKGSYGIWDDPIWVDYLGDQRFLEDDIVTVWGTVEGLQKYTAVLGNQVTVPHIAAIDIQLGEVTNPQPAIAPAATTASTAAPAAPGSPLANRNANLRAGPGTGFAVVGSTKTGDALAIVARNADGSWFQLAGGAWIAAFLVDNGPANADLPLAPDLPAQPEPTPTAQPEATTETAEPTVAALANNQNPPGMLAIGQEVEAKGWRFKVSEIHKRKAVYFYNNSRVAMGYYLVVIIDATNLQSGTDYFARNLDPWVADTAGNVFSISGAASGYAQWQYDGISSIYTDVNPGNFVRIALAVDLPESTGQVQLGTEAGHSVDLGDFAALAVEDR